LPEARGCGDLGIDSNTDFFRRERFVSLKRYCEHDVNQGSIPMTFVSRLSVVTAYVAFAFVGAIVLGVI
jgi:hypothetical protein